MKKTAPKGWISLALFLIMLTACITVESPALPTPAPPGMGTGTSIPSLTPTLVPMAAPYEVATPHRQGMAASAPLNPPEYSPSGNVVAEAAAALSTEGYWWALYEMYQAEREAKDFYAEGELTAQQVFEAQMEEFAREKGLQVFQSERPDGMGLTSFPVKDNGDGTWSMWRFATPGGAFSAQPDLPPTADSTWVEIVVDGGIGGSWGEDGHFYVFRLDEQGRATHWFNAVESTTSEVVWVETESYLESLMPEPVFSMKLEGKVEFDGGEIVIPLEIGLMQDLVEREVEPITGFTVNPERPDAADKLAWYYLRQCWHNHTQNYEADASMSWEEYLAEVQVGRGLIRVVVADPSVSSWDSPAKPSLRIVEKSPLGGLTVYKADGLLGMNGRVYALFVIENSSGGLLMVAPEGSSDDYSPAPSNVVRNSFFVSTYLQSIMNVMGVDVDKVVESGYYGSVFYTIHGSVFYEEFNKLLEDYFNLLSMEFSRPYFVIEQ